MPYLIHFQYTAIDASQIKYQVVVSPTPSRFVVRTVKVHLSSPIHALVDDASGLQASPKVLEAAKKGKKAYMN